MTPAALRTRTWPARTLRCLRTRGPPQTRTSRPTATTRSRQPHSSPRRRVASCPQAPFGVYDAPHADDAVCALGATLHAARRPRTGAALQVPEGAHELGMLVRAAVAPHDIMYYVMKHVKNDF
jgi:hypothetical protein